MAPTEEERLAKERRIKREKAKLRRLLRDIGKPRLAAVDKLLGNLAFMAVTMEDLENHLNTHGITSRYQNGENQWGDKKSGEAEFYAQLSQRYLTAINRLLDLLPAGPPSQEPTSPGSRVRAYVQGDNGSH